MTGFTNIITKVGNHKSDKFVQNEPEHLWLLIIWFKCNKLKGNKLTQNLVKIPKYEIS